MALFATIRSTSWILTLQVLATLLRTVAAGLLARVLGVEGFGHYAFAMGVVAVLQVPASLGLPNLLTRSVAVAKQAGESRGLFDLIVRSHVLVLFAGVLLAGVAVLVGGLGSTTAEATFALAMAIVPFAALNMVRQASVQGLGGTTEAQVPDLLIQPVLLTAGAAILFFAQRVPAPPPLAAVWIQLFSVLVASLFGVYGLLRSLPKSRHPAERPLHSSSLFKEALPFFVLSGLAIASSRLDIVLVGLLRPVSEVGVYRAAVTLAAVAAFGLQAVNLASAPRLATAWAAQRTHELRRIAHVSAIMGTLCALPVAGVCAFFGVEVLGIVFGDEFDTGARSLVVLVFGQLLNSAFGPVGTILNMTGHQARTLRALVFSAVANVSLIVVLVPTLGIDGAAIAASVALITWNFLLHRDVMRLIGIDASIFGISRAILARRE